MAERRIKQASPEEVADLLSDASIPYLNELTQNLANVGIAATFSQYIKEFHDAETSELVRCPKCAAERPVNPDQSVATLEAALASCHETIDKLREELDEAHERSSERDPRDI